MNLTKNYTLPITIALFSACLMLSSCKKSFDDSKKIWKSYLRSGQEMLEGSSDQTDMNDEANFEEFAEDVLPENYAAAVSTYDSLYNAYKTVMQEGLERRMDKRVNFWNIPRMYCVSKFAFLSDYRASSTRKYFTKEFVSVLPDMIARSGRQLTASEADAEQIITDEILERIMDRESSEMIDLMIGSLIDAGIAFLLSLLGIYVGGCLGQIAVFILGFIISWIPTYFIIMPIEARQNVEIVQMLLDSYLNYFEGQELLTQLLSGIPL